MIEKKTTRQILIIDAKIGKNALENSNFEPVFNYHDQIWISKDSLLPKLQEAFNKFTTIQTKVALNRIIKELDT